LCHTALVWERTVDGRALDFRLWGINNQNFIMRDDQTGTWWQQVTGEAIHGPLKGRRLAAVVHDEVSFGIWRAEHPGGRVLRPDPRFADGYESRNWERKMKTFRTVTPLTPGDPLRPRSVVVGVTIDGHSKAYPFASVRAQTIVLDTLGGAPIAVVVAGDHSSVRVFDRRLDGRALELLAKPDAEPLRLVDAETGSEWDFSGTAVSGPLAGRSLAKVKALKEYWFDWKLYQPGTTIDTR